MDTITTLISKLEYWEETYLNINTEHNDLLCRLVGVSDTVLLDQLTEEYQEILTKLNDAEACLKNIEKQYMSFLIESWIEENKLFYSNQFIEDELIVCLEINNRVTLQKKLNDLRIRIPKDLCAKRELNILAKEFKKKIKVLDFQCNEVDTYGTHPDEWILYTNNLKTYYNKSLLT